MCVFEIQFAFIYLKKKKGAGNTLVEQGSLSKISVCAKFLFRFCIGTIKSLPLAIKKSLNRLSVYTLIKIPLFISGQPHFNLKKPS